MLDLPENELLSAYIDGELTADEQAEVEQLLTDNPEAQQLVDELRSLSASLQTLPAYKLDEDLAARVLRQAEQEMLAHPATPLPGFHQVDVPEPKGRSWARRLLRPRNFAWSAVAIAVAVLLMLNESGTNRGEQNDVARVPESVTIEPLDIGPTIEVSEDPSEIRVAKLPDSAPPESAVPDRVGPVADPASEPPMMAELAPEAGTESNRLPSVPDDEADPLLVLQCQLAEGSVGHEALSQLLEHAGVVPEEPVAEGDGPVELTLTTNQVRRVVAQLSEEDGDFTGFSYLSTPKGAGPRIPSALGPGGSHPNEAAMAEGPDAGGSAQDAIPVQGANTVQAAVVADANPEETANVDGNARKVGARIKVGPGKGSQSLPVKDDCTYRVRFLLKPAKQKAPVDQ